MTTISATTRTPAADGAMRLVAVPSLERLCRDPGYPALLAIGKTRHLTRNHVVIQVGARPESLYLLVGGLCSVRQLGSKDQELLLGYFCPGDFFGEMGLFPGVQERSAMISTAADSTLLEIPYAAFLDLTRRHPSFWLELAGQLATRLRTTNRQLAEMPVLHASDRLWQALSDIAANGGGGRVADGRSIRITRQDLGKLAGCSRELAGMILRDLELAGRIRVRGQTIVLLDHPVPAQAAAAAD